VTETVLAAPDEEPQAPKVDAALINAQLCSEELQAILKKYGMEMATTNAVVYLKPV